MTQAWFDSSDWPLQGDGDWPGRFPREATSASGLRFVLDLDHGGERCLREKLDHWWDRRIVCMMPKGHDTPHMPMTLAVEADAGPMMVRSITRQPSPMPREREGL